MDISSTRSLPGVGMSRVDMSKGRYVWEWVSPEGLSVSGGG